MTEKQQVLVVDDDVQVGTFFKRLLERKNIQVAVADSGDQARQALRKQAFQAALLDLNLPDADGLQLLQEIKSIQPHSAVIIMTGYSTTRTATQGAEADPVGRLQSYLGEDFAWEQLPAEQLMTAYRLARALVQRLGTALDRCNLPGEQIDRTGRKTLMPKCAQIKQAMTDSM